MDVKACPINGYIHVGSVKNVSHVQSGESIPLSYLHSQMLIMNGGRLRKKYC